MLRLKTENGLTLVLINDRSRLSVGKLEMLRIEKNTQLRKASGNKMWFSSCTLVTITTWIRCHKCIKQADQINRSNQSINPMTQAHS